MLPVIRLDWKVMHLGREVTMGCSARLVLLAGLAAGSAFAGPVVHTTDFIDNDKRTAFADFETLDSSYNGGAGAPTFTQDGIHVEQRNGGGNDIWSLCRAVCWYANDTKSWYPNFGDNAWTEIALAGGAEFNDVGMDVGSIKQGATTLQYELLKGGLRVLLGEITYPSGQDGYIGFSGGGFDTIRLRLGFGTFGGDFGNGIVQGVAIDNIEVVPEPGAAALFGIALVAAARARKSGRRGARRDAAQA